MSTTDTTDLEIVNVCAGDFTPTTMASATDSWALVTHPDQPGVHRVRPVTAWAHGQAALITPTGQLVAESFTTALIDMGSGLGMPAAELVASGYEVTTGPRAWIDEELEDRRR